MGGQDGIPQVFHGGDVTADGSGWTVATGSARATGTPAGAVAEWMTPAVIVGGLVLVVAVVWKRS